eukprot:3888863-Amphidinium_carterae.1
MGTRLATQSTGDTSSVTIADGLMIMVTNATTPRSLGQDRHLLLLSFKRGKSTHSILWEPSRMGIAERRGKGKQKQ